MKKILVAYYSRTGNTEKMAHLVAEGAKSESGVEVEVRDIASLPAEEALKYDGIIIGSPTYYGSMAFEVKKFFDDSVKFHGKLKGKAGGAFSSAANIGGGNETTILGILNAMIVHGMIIQGDPSGDHYGTVSIGSPDSRVEKQCRALGKKIALLTKKVT